MKVINNSDLKIKKMDLRNHLYALFPLIIFTLVISIGVYLFYKKFGIPDRSIQTVMILLYSVFAIPAIFLHFEYIVNDWGTSLTIDNKNKKITYKKSNYEISFDFDEIEKVCYYGEIKDFNNLTTQNHSFYFFKVKNTNPFIVSCLTIRNLEYIIYKVNIIKNRRLFPSILFENLNHG